MAGSPVMLSHVELVVPQPEYDFLQAKAQGAGSFAVQLTGDLGQMHSSDLIAIMSLDWCFLQSVSSLLL